MKLTPFYKLFSMAGSSPFYLGITGLVGLFWSSGLALRLFCGFAALMAICYTIKLFYRKPRPDAAVRPAGAGWFSWLDAASFPSVHSARAAVLALCFIQSLPLIALYPLAVAFVSGVGLARIKLRRHFLLDVIGGVVIGALVAALTESIRFPF